MKPLNMTERGTLSHDASILLAATTEDKRNQALQAIASALRSQQDFIIEANQKDLEMAKANKLDAPLLKRLRFNTNKIEDVIAGIESLIHLPDPIGLTQMATELDKGLELYRVTCPIGVIGVIFESRPDAFVQIATLCLKSGNAVLLKGGHESRYTNRTLFKVIQGATQRIDLPKNWIQNLETREDVNDMLAQSETIDLIIPRGSNAFVKYIMDHTTIPVMGHADGLCHVYIDQDADLKKAVALSVDSKAQYVSVCNAAETLLVHRAIAADFLPALKSAMERAHVTLRGDAKVQNYISVYPATEADWETEYLDYTLSVKIVDSLNEAICHINRYGSGHTDAIVTENGDAAKRFTTLVDSAGVYVNASTRFADGYRYGFGAEVGISTGKLHARGPVGLEGLVSYKYKLIGHGQIVADYANGQAQFTHRSLQKKCPL
ncbi:glutamate-5-semialdehyde dehydrogenase [Pseudoramibacter alactolyticus]|jgi:glutamate-5-semialdehyde dehydrogenase|uniref:glutamate-5-semialdehyde dehydrogenase n=1 Tax=Pseudoramibacter alactolyticus TaxID=113287 RepID=UPI002352CC06|nr:glutamate-5-semialdehyde dehydrogenase [Pseudoramibacter alactolyticus]